MYIYIYIFIYMHDVHLHVINEVCHIVFQQMNALLKVSHMIESCDTFVWVISYTWMRHVIHMYMTHVQHINESRHTVCQQMNALRKVSHIIVSCYVSCHTSEWEMSHIWISDVNTYEWVTSHVWMSHVIQSATKWMPPRGSLWRLIFVAGKFKIHKCVYIRIHVHTSAHKNTLTHV